MDAQRFDSFVRALTDGASRRHLLGLMLGGVIGTSGFAAIEAKRKGKKKKKCKGNKKKCGKKCIPKTNCCTSANCDEGETCQNGACIGCTPDCAGKECGSNGCGGSCGSCSGNETCQGGTCVCAPNCTDKECGDNGCGGSCGSCESNEICQSGTCICPTECCTNANCPPGSGMICVSGSCACPPGEFLSGGVCGEIPNCKGFNGICGFDVQCCGGLCAGANCACSAEGLPCFEDDDCCGVGLTCRGFVCSVT